MRERQGVRGRLIVEARAADGSRVVLRRADNLVTDAGKQLLADLFTGTVQNHQLLVAVGGAGEPPSPADTALGQEIERVKAEFAAPAPRVEDGAAMIVVAVSAELQARGDGEPQVLREAGIVAKIPGGQQALYNHVVFDPITRSATLELTLTWEILF